MLPNNLDLTLTELQEMSSRQQHQIEINEQILAAKEQRLKYLKEQELKQQRVIENFRFKKVKDQVEAHELKLLKLKALRKIINDYKAANPCISSELEILKALCAEKERELSSTVAKVDELNRQIDQLRRLKSNRGKESCNKTRSEIDKLKQELVIRNKLNEQQSKKIAAQKEIYMEKQNELLAIDKKLQELTEKLYKQKLLHLPFTQSTSTILEQDKVSNDGTAFNQSKWKFETSRKHFNLPSDSCKNPAVDCFSNVVKHSISDRDGSVKSSDTVSSKTENSGANAFSNNFDACCDLNGLQKSPKVTFASKQEIAVTYMQNLSSEDQCAAISPKPAVKVFPFPQQLSASKQTTLLTFKPNLDTAADLSTANDTSTFSDPPAISSKLRIDDDKLHMHLNVTNIIKKRHSITDAEGSSFTVSPIALTKLIDDTRQISFDSCNETDSVDEFHLKKIQAPSSLKKSSLKKSPCKKSNKQVSFDPLAILLDAAVEGELDLVMKAAQQVSNPSHPNDEGITALHNAVCAGNFDCVQFLVEYGCDVNYADNDGWTPLHCAASCNNLMMVKFLIEHGAAVFAQTYNDNETAAEKCEEEEPGYESCSEYLCDIQNKMGIMNKSEVFAVYDYDACNSDELSFSIGDKLIIIRRGDVSEENWWWAQRNGFEGYIPRNYIGLYPRVQADNSAQGAN